MSTGNTSTTAPTADGVAETRDGKTTLRYRRELAHPVRDVWAAITEPAELAGWIADAQLDLVHGGSVVLRWKNTDLEGNNTVLHGTITELDEPWVLEYDTDIFGLLRFELREVDGGTELTFSSTMEVTEEQLAMNLAGWHWHLDRLADTLAGRPYDWSRWTTEGLSSWEKIHEAYLAKCA